MIPGGLDVDVTINGGNVRIDNLNAGGTGYSAGDEITFRGSLVGGADLVNDLTLTVGAAALNEDITLDITKVQGGVDSVTYNTGTAQTSWSYTNQSAGNVSGGFTGSGLSLDFDINRSGELSNIAINNGGQNYQPNDVVQFPDPAQGGGGNYSNAQITLQAAHLERNFTGTGLTVDNTPPTISGITGDQYIPDPAGAGNMSTNLSVDIPNDVGVAKEIRVAMSSDGGTDGLIAPGDIFNVRVSEVLHGDESTPNWPENAVKTALATPALTDANVISVTAQQGETTDDVANNLVTQINNYITTNFTPAEQEHLPTASYNNGDNYLKFTANKAGEDFDVEVDFDSSVDTIEGTGASDRTTNPNGKSTESSDPSAVKNISPFSITKSISYFEEMLAQNEAETSRLQKAMEHLENSMVHNEDALSKVVDTDYSQASVQQMRNAVKMQMANNVIGKSMRMNDLLVDLTTKHHRGAMLNAKA